jgi:predicted AAA+ superfamily ATPase
MERIAINDLISWKKKVDRKPLIIRGARQVGKTWLMKEFGRTEYAQTAYVNFESSKRLKTLFVENFDVARIIMALEIETSIRINPTNTLLIFDEIQEAEGAISSLKYFHENAPQYHIMAAGSLLGVALHASNSFPVGKVEFLDMHPFTFPEFLRALGQQSLENLLQSGDWILIKSFKDKFIQLLKQYYYIGGMPEAIASFIQHNDFNAVRDVQKRILIAYELDFSKHAPSDIVPRIRMLWNSIPSQLARENKKFIYGAVKSGSRAKDYELALSWLLDCGLVHKVNRVSKPGIPLKAYEDTSSFKLFIADVGLLTTMGDIDIRTILEGNRIFEEFKGALTEQFVLQQLVANRELTIYYWTADRANAEIDFVVQHVGGVIPIEVKAEENLQAKSLQSFVQKYKPDIAIRTSMSDYRKEEWLINLPLYAINGLPALLV